MFAASATAYRQWMYLHIPLIPLSHFGYKGCIEANRGIRLIALKPYINVFDCASTLAALAAWGLSLFEWACRCVYSDGLPDLWHSRRLLDFSIPFSADLSHQCIPEGNQWPFRRAGCPDLPEQNGLGAGGQLSSGFHGQC